MKKLFLKIMLITFIVVIVGGGIGAAVVFTVYDNMILKEDKAAAANRPVYNRNENVEQQEINQNIAIFGVDQDEIRTDVIFVVNVNTTSGAIKVIAVPRDTKVTWSSYQQDKMEELGKGYYTETKITEMSAHGGLDNLKDFTINSLEDIMGIKIDHYAVINTKAFRKIVDALGGVEVDVPREMHYSDSSQELYIDLEEGLQTLDGRQAEGLVRWRHNDDYSEQYAEGDVGRIETQQIFLTALAKKVLSTNNIKDLLGIMNVVYSDLRTDVSLLEVPKYLSYLKGFSAGDISFYTLPGEAVREDKWYYILDNAQMDTFMQQIFYEE